MPVWVVPRLDAKKVVGAGDWWVSGNWTLALGTDGTVWSWGHNGDGQLGDGTFDHSRSTPGVLGLPHRRRRRRRRGEPRARRPFGRERLELGTHTPAAGSSRLPVRVAGLSDIVAVAAGIDFSLALRNDGRVFAWGMNGYGQLGDGSQWVNRANPVQVAGLTAVRSIAAGPSSSFAIKSNGAVVAWGAGGTLGDGGTSNKLTPYRCRV